MKMLTTLLSLSMCILFCPCSLSASAVPLSDLLAGSSLTVADKLFDNWSWSIIEVTGNASSPDPSMIEVSPLISSGFDPGLHFDANTQLWVEGEGQVFLTLEYDVTVLDPLLRINGNQMRIEAFNQKWGPSGPNDYQGMMVTHKITEPSGSFDDTRIEFASSNGIIIQDFIDAVTFSNQEEFTVQQTINIQSTVGVFPDEFTWLSSWSSTYAQQPVPIPTTILLLSTGLVGLAGLRRKKLFKE